MQAKSIANSLLEPRVPRCGARGCRSKARGCRSTRLPKRCRRRHVITSGAAALLAWSALPPVLAEAAAAAVLACSALLPVLADTAAAAPLAVAAPPPVFAEFAAAAVLTAATPPSACKVILEYAVPSALHAWPPGMGLPSTSWCQLPLLSIHKKGSSAFAVEPLQRALLSLATTCRARAMNPP
eukprot:scaffold502_cov63-Phaeocystis_antarctica.AAC.2